MAKLLMQCNVGQFFTYKHCEILVSCSDKEMNWNIHETDRQNRQIHAHETACKLMELHVQAYVTAYKLM